MRDEFQHAGEQFYWDSFVIPTYVLKLAPDIRDSASFCCYEGLDQIGHQMLKIYESVGSGSQHNNGNAEGGEILLK